MGQADLQHELLQAVKDLALELGRVPTRSQFTDRVVGGSYRLAKTFGSYAALLQAAGLETYDDRRCENKKITRESLFGRDIAETIENHTPRIVESRPENFEPILCIGDTHFPFVHKPTLEKIYRFAEQEQPAHIVQLGDLQDQFAHSRFPASRAYLKPDEEMELARKESLTFWKELQKAAPKAKCYQITGNHDIRALKLVLQAAPTLESLVKESIEKLYVFDNVTTIHDYRQELIIQDIMFHHGYMTRHGMQRDFVMNNFVSAHTHKAAVTYRAMKNKTIWHLDCGFVGDAESKAMSYTPQKITGWTLGFGFIDRHGPRFVPA